MGIETALIIGLTAASALGQIENSKQQAKAITKEGNIAAQNKARETQIKAARVQNSFMNSGLTLEGTPENVITGTYDTGIKDINQIKSNYDSQAKNVISQGRTAALSTMAGSFAGAGFGSSMGSMGDLFSKAGSYLPDSFAYGLNNMGFGQTAYDMLEQGDLNSHLRYSFS